MSPTGHITALALAAIAAGCSAASGPPAEPAAPAELDRPTEPETPVNPAAPDAIAETTSPDEKEDDPAPGDESLSVFYDALAPYGDWIFTDDYGWVWAPSSEVVGDDFIPYASNGQWLYTNNGWYFDSAFSWGWAPFHYGRWYDDATFGWLWVPGEIWSPAWVDWRVGVGVVGWSPLPPPHRRRTHPGRWVFMHQREFGRGRIAGRLLNRERARRAYRRTRPTPGTRVVGDHRMYRGPNLGQRRHPIHVVPPRAGAISRVRIHEPTARVQPIRPRPGVSRPVERRPPASRARPPRRGPRMRPSRAIRAPVRQWSSPRQRHRRTGRGRPGENAGGRRR